VSEKKKKEKEKERKVDNITKDFFVETGEKERERRKLLFSDTKCLNPQCNNFARVKSRYCSHECGIACALPKAEEELRTEEELQRFIHKHKHKQTST
jgi:hypothetical protein